MRLFALLLTTVALRAAGPTAPESVDSIMRKIVAAYSDATSYQDEGVTLSHDPKKDQPDEIVFKTAFKRPAYFRFEWISHHPYPPLRHLKTLSIAWGNDTGVFTYRQPPPLPNAAGNPALEPMLRTETNIGGALGAAAGVSRLSSVTVICLLTPDVRGASLLGLKSLDLVGIEDFENVSCYRLHGLDSRGFACDFWVGTSDFLIRRVMRINGASGHQQEEIRRKVEINRDLPAATFEGPASK